MQLESVWHSEQGRRTQSEWATFRVRRDFDVIAIRVRIKQRRFHACGHRQRFLRARRNVHVVQATRKRLHERGDILVNEC